MKRTRRGVQTRLAWRDVRGRTTVYPKDAGVCNRPEPQKSALVHTGASGSSNKARQLRVGRIAMHIATMVPLGFTLSLTSCVTVAAASGLEPSYLLEGHFALGVGMTYQYDGSEGTNLALATWSARDDHYELAAF